VSSTPYGEPLELLIRPSRLIATLLVTLHLLALAACAPLPLPFLWRAVLVLSILGAFVNNGLLYLKRTPKRLHWSPEEGWTLTARDDTDHPVELLPEVYLSPWLVVIHFRDERAKRRTVMLAQDSVRAEGFRRLKVLLRYGAPKH
jgi:hypothetical protein